MKYFLILLIVIISIIFLSIIAQYFGEKSFAEDVNDEVKLIFESNNVADNEIVTEESIQHLPLPVQSYLKFSGIIGKPKITSTRLKQSANIKLEAGSEGFDHTAVQYFTSRQPAFVWFADMPLFPGFSMKVRDKVINGKGEMLGKLLSLFPVVFADGPKIDQGALARYVGEMVWQPSAFLESYCTWEEIDSSSARIRVKVNDIEVNGVFTFDEENKIKTFVCPRWKNVEDTEMSTYINYFLEYKTMGGLNIPNRGQAVWREENGSEFIYWDGYVIEIEYNVPDVYLN